jgi:hypothetical protein
MATRGNAEGTEGEVSSQWPLMQLIAFVDSLTLSPNPFGARFVMIDLMPSGAVSERGVWNVRRREGRGGLDLAIFLKKESPEACPPDSEDRPRIVQLIARERQTTNDAPIVIQA